MQEHPKNEEPLPEETGGGLKGPGTPEDGADPVTPPDPPAPPDPETLPDDALAAIPEHLQGAGETRAGMVALVGRPNVGKSTLMNAFIGEKLSIVTSREQTTRERVLGILTEDGVQMIFVDTPGLLEPRYLLHESMVGEAVAALLDADVVLLLLDPTRTDAPADEEVLEKLRSRGPALHVAINKVDIGDPGVVQRLVDWSRRELHIEPHRISAEKGEGLEALKEALAAGLPESPYLYPPEDLAAQPVRFFVAELIRETIFEEYGQEIPYSTVVGIEEYRESEDPVYIRAEVYVDRKSQKGIIIGKGGRSIKRLGSRARSKIEAFTGTRVYLDLWVKPLPGWRKKADALKRLGYHIPEDS
ncbi:MAG: GTPase Era [Longimicrobiales bacterium]